jgi:hypothetical protein
LREGDEQRLLVVGCWLLEKSGSHQQPATYNQQPASRFCGQGCWCEIIRIKIRDYIRSQFFELLVPFLAADLVAVADEKAL